MSRALTSFSIAIAVTLLSAASCSTTAGVPVQLAIAFEGSANATFTTVSGWAVELSEARALVGPIYLYEALDASALRIVAPSRAFAHGGFDPLEGRRVLAELLEQHAYDALASSPIEIASIEGLAGVVDTTTLILDAPAGELARDDGPTHGHHVWVAGIARRDGVEIAFEGGLDLPNEPQRRVSGVLVDPPEALADGARVAFGADPAAWLSEADFSELTVDADGIASFAPDSEPERALFLGARSAGSWTARIEGGAP